MGRKTYEEQMQLAEAKVLIGEKPNYWRAYQQGLMRKYHGDTVVSPQEHRVWMEKANSAEDETFEEGKGYMDGFLA